MTKLYLHRILLIMSCISNIRGGNFYDDDDMFNESNAMINVDLYKNYRECSNKINILYKYRKNFYIDCNCFIQNNCYNKLKESHKLKYYSFDYNNKTFELDNLNVTKQCYNINGLYIHMELNMYNYCVDNMVLFIIILIVGLSFYAINIKYFINKHNKHNNQLSQNNHPPLYQYQSIN